MAKNIFSIRCLLRNKTKSIQQISSELIDVIEQLAKLDESFYCPVYAKLGFKSKEIDIKSLGNDEAKSILSQLILTTNLKDIKRNNKAPDPDITFSRDLGFMLLLQYFHGKQNLFSITGNLGSNSYPYLCIEYFYSDQEFSFQWYEKILHCLVKTLNPLYAGVAISITPFIMDYGKLMVKLPFGWITYFSNDYESKIPDDLKYVEYEYTDQGKYIILTREDFTTNPEVYDTHRDKLLAIMEDVKQRVPEYSL